jgi:hypothetical protein
VPQPGVGQASHGFRIILPWSELREVGTPKKSSKIIWVEPPQSGNAAQFECYLAPVPAEQIGSQHLPHKLIAALSLLPGYSFVVLHNEEAISEEKSSLLEVVRAEIILRTKEAGLQIRPTLRGVAFLIADDGARGFIEVAPSEGAA